jgi:hypothetical protein
MQRELMHHPSIETTMNVYGRAVISVDARLDGRTFVKFHVDLGVGDEALEPSGCRRQRLARFRWHSRSGRSCALFRATLAEKFHAYTRPRETTNSRVRDLVDLMLILERDELSSDRLRPAVNATFTRRHTHPIPVNVPAPPSSWTKPFAALAAECGVHYTPATA